MSIQTKPAQKKRSLRRSDEDWKYLESRPHRWRKQLYVKGSRLRAFSVWRDMEINGESVEQAAKNWDLPVDVVEECIRYCRMNEELLYAECDEEKRRLIAAGVQLEPPPTRR